MIGVFSVVLSGHCCGGWPGKNEQCCWFHVSFDDFNLTSREKNNKQNRRWSQTGVLLLSMAMARTRWFKKKASPQNKKDFLVWLAEPSHVVTLRHTDTLINSRRSNTLGILTSGCGLPVCLARRTGVRWVPSQRKCPSLKRTWSSSRRERPTSGSWRWVLQQAHISAAWTFRHGSRLWQLKCLQVFVASIIDLHITDVQTCFWSTSTKSSVCSDVSLFAVWHHGREPDL